MCLAQVLVAVGVAAVVPHVDGRHLGDVQGAVVPEVLEDRKEESGGRRMEGGGGSGRERYGMRGEGPGAGRRCRTSGGDGERRGAPRATAEWGGGMGGP